MATLPFINFWSCASAIGSSDNYSKWKLHPILIDGLHHYIRELHILRKTMKASKKQNRTAEETNNKGDLPGLTRILKIRFDGKICGRESILERAKHKREYDNRMNERQMQSKEEKIDSSKALDDDLVVTEISGTEPEKHDTSSRSENDTHAEDADIKPMNDKDSMVETYKDLYDSIKKTPVQTKDLNDSLIAQVNSKTIENADLKDQIQEKVFANVA
nr:B-cell receptor-associated protein 31-like [Tanacetum cinerariifolium]